MAGQALRKLSAATRLRDGEEMGGIAGEGEKRSKLGLSDDNDNRKGQKWTSVPTPSRRAWSTCSLACRTPIYIPLMGHLSALEIFRGSAQVVIPRTRAA